MRAIARPAARAPRRHLPASAMSHAPRSCDDAKTHPSTMRPALRVARRGGPHFLVRAVECSGGEPSLLSINSAIRLSMVCAAIMRHAVTGSSDRCGDCWSVAWVCSRRSRTARPARCGGDLQVDAHAGRCQGADRMATSGSFTKASMFLCRDVGVWSPRMTRSGSPAWQRPPARRP